MPCFSARMGAEGEEAAVAAASRLGMEASSVTLLGRVSAVRKRSGTSEGVQTFS